MSFQVHIIIINFTEHSPEIFYRVTVLETFAKFTRKHPQYSPFFDKVAGKIGVQVFVSCICKVFRNKCFKNHECFLLKLSFIY